MKFIEAYYQGKYIQREIWSNDLIQIYLCGKKLIIEHVNNSIEEHDYLLDVDDLIADDWKILNKE